MSSPTEPTTFGLSVHQVKSLLRIGTASKGSRGKGDDPRVRGTLLGEWLERSVPEEMMEMLPDSRARLSGRPVRSLLLAADTELAVFKHLKVLYKEQIAVADGSAQRDVATVLYYATIACGLLHHQRRLTSYSYRELAQAFAVLARKKWLEAGLRELFWQAGRLCKGGRDRPDGCDHE